MCIFRTPYSKAVRAPSRGIEFTEESRTLQSEYESTTIDWYLKRYSATGIDPFANRLADARFGDFSNYESFLTAQTRLARVREGFDALPAEVRARFGNSINQFMEFVTNPNNADELKSMGLVTVADEAQTGGTGSTPAHEPEPTPVEAAPAPETVGSQGA